MHERWLALLSVVIATGAAVMLAHTGTGQQRRDTDVALALSGSAENGRQIIQASGCGACHEIPHIPGARGRVGPSLAGLAGRAVIGGKFPNTPANLQAWIEDPRRLDRDTAMPSLGLSAEQARVVSAWLYAQAK